MPTGDPRPHRVLAFRRAGGYTFLMLLLWLALAGAGLAAAGTAWSTAAQRGREAEWWFRAGQYSRALASYARSTPAGTAARPAALADLLEDRRAEPPRRHLRRLWPDPYTGAPDWQVLVEDGRVLGLRSRATAPLFRAPAGGLAIGDARAADWVFTADGATLCRAAEASADTPTPSKKADCG